MLEKLLIEDQIATAAVESAGTIPEEMDLIWQAKDLEVKDKIDSYGYLFAHLDAEETKLKELKAEGSKRISKALERLENLRARIKSRLNLLAGNDPLRGRIYSFHPYVSTKREISDVSALSDSESYLTIEIRKDYWNVITSNQPWLEGERGELPCYKIKKVDGKVSELSPDHPAVVTKLEPSIRIT